MRMGSLVGLPPDGAGKAHRADQEVGPQCVPRMAELCVCNFSMKPAIAPTTFDPTLPSSTGKPQFTAQHETHSPVCKNCSGLADLCFTYCECSMPYSQQRAKTLLTRLLFLPTCDQCWGQLSPGKCFADISKDIQIVSHGLMNDLGRVHTQCIESPGRVSRGTHNYAISPNHQAQPFCLCHHIL